jgi:hypothetical protein
MMGSSIGGSGGAGGSGGISFDGGTPCGMKSGFGISSAGDASGPMSCGSGMDYKCGASSYEILCECSEATCTCTKDKVLVGKTGYSGCPSCSVSPRFAVVAKACGIPF